MMKLIALLLGLANAQTRLTYDDGTIGGLEYTISNPDFGSATIVMPSTEFSEQTDDDLTTGWTLEYPDTNYRTWGDSSANPTIGMKGDFYAVDLNPGQGNAFYQITTAEITFVAESCFSDDATAEFTYVNTQGTTVVGTTVTMTELSTPTGGFTFSADLGSGIQVDNDGPLGFNIQSNQYCEGTYDVTEFVLEGTAIATTEPSESPTKKPTAAPTTGEPTMAPTQDCDGEVTWGDPHYQLLGTDNSAWQFNYQELGWFYYIAPCNLTDFEHFPFFLLSYHMRCYWQNNPKGCISNNTLILNTKPDPWIIHFEESGLFINPGSDVGTPAYSGWIDLDPLDGESNALEINYNDGNALTDNPPAPNQSGKLKIWMENGQIVLELSDVQYDAQPRQCVKNTKSGRKLECGSLKADGEVIQVRNSGTWTVYTCPKLLRGISCGLMGRFYRGDCTRDQLQDSDDICSEILQGSDGTIYQDSRGRAIGDTAFGNMADTWEKNYVADLLKNDYGYTVNFALGRDKPYQHTKKRTNKKSSGSQGRSISVPDISNLEGDCKDNPTKVAEVNETCRLNTVVKYEKCCKEIGFCDLLWGACIEDFCSCAGPDAPDTITDEWCLDTIIHQSMNTTCSVPWLYPTATPTNAPTPSPTGLIGSLPTGTKAEDLIWLYLIFVVIFVIIAGGAYWYYRKKNNIGKANFDDDIEAPQEATGNTYE